MLCRCVAGADRGDHVRALKVEDADHDLKAVVAVKVDKEDISLGDGGHEGRRVELVGVKAKALGLDDLQLARRVMR